MTDQPEKIRACDILNWEFLLKIADNTHVPARTLIEGAAVLAYDITSTADEDRRDQILAECLINATHLQSAKTAKLIVERLATTLKSDCQKLKQFARQNGVRL